MMEEDFLKKYEKVPVIEYENCVEQKPLVTVSVLAYQHVNYIKECLDGIMEQKTTFPFEVLIGEDDSIDGTRQICIEYARKFPKKIRLFLHSRGNNIHINGSPTWHFNSIYNNIKSRGNYIALCEADDYWNDPNKLQKQIDFLEANKDFSACAHLSNVIFDNVENQNEHRYNRQHDKSIFVINDFLEYTRFHTGSLVFRKKLNNLDIKKKYGLFELNRDHPLVITLAANGPIMRLPEVMSTYRRNQGGVSFRSDIRSLYELNINMVNALSGYLKGFQLRSFYMKGHWHRTMLNDENESFVRKLYHFIFFFVSSFYIFPKNGKKIIVSFKLLIGL